MEKYQKVCNCLVQFIERASSVTATVAEIAALPHVVNAFGEIIKLPTLRSKV